MHPRRGEAVLVAASNQGHSGGLMGSKMLDEEFDSAAGRRIAWRSLWLEDHGFLRKIYRNHHDLPDGMARSAQPSPGDIRRWADEGIKTVINLRGLVNNPRQPGFWHLEREACDAAGITLINHRAYSREAPSPGFINELDRLFQKIAYPAVMHCKSGADRAGLGAFLYMFLRMEAPLAEAREQLSLRYGHIRSGQTGVLDHFVDTYEEAAAREGERPGRDHFLAWVNGPYDQDAVKKGFKPKALGSLVTETLLRRE